MLEVPEMEEVAEGQKDIVAVGDMDKVADGQ